MCVVQAINFLDPTELFKGEHEETMPRVEVALKIVRAFRQCYMEHRARLPTYFDMVRENLGTDDPLDDGSTPQDGADTEEAGTSSGGAGVKKKKLIYWEFSPQLVFCRYDKFIARLELIMVSNISRNNVLPRLMYDIN